VKRVPESTLGRERPVGIIALMSGESAAESRGPSIEVVQQMALAAAAPFRFDGNVSGVRIVVSDKLPSSAGVQFEKWLTASVRDLRPALKPFASLVVAMNGDDEERIAIATAAGDAAIIVWFRKQLWYSRRHPEITVGTLEHEAAHILWERTGIPNDESWEVVVREDATDPSSPLEACLVVPAIATAYERSEWLKEDWAYSVELSRDSKFEGRFAARNRLIDEVLGD
jgi:hypothetical protein